MENAASPAGAGACRILLVEEDPSYRATLTQMLQHRGYPVTAMASPEEGLRALRENPEEFDLVMTVAETKGPGIDGFELFKQVNESYPVILLSDYAPVETVLRALAEGACDFMAKPLEDWYIRDIWQLVLRWQVNAASGGTDEGDSDGSQQQKQQDRTTKKTNFNSSPHQHALVAKPAEQLREAGAIGTVDQKEGSGEHVPAQSQDKFVGDRTKI